MEEFLDDISAGSMQWKKLLTGFWTKFHNNIEAVQPLQVSEVIDKIDEVLAYHLFPEKEDGSDPRLCPDCGKGHLSIKLGKFGAFLGCSNYPECKYTMPLTDVKDEEENSTEKKPNPEDKILGEHNGLNVYLKKGPYGFYIQLGEELVMPKKNSYDKETSTIKLLKVEGEYEDYQFNLALVFEGKSYTFALFRDQPYLVLSDDLAVEITDDYVFDYYDDRVSLNIYYN
jgi:ssDNA-binding Zn-finger/Zn-ribbon topoisomerase 1